ncbi:MAG: bifunctional riboflavin kinase/FAD synthetase [Terriglobales bacterium]
MALMVSSAAGLATLPRGAILTIGNFDGVHRAHQRVLAEVVAQARAAGAPAVAMTFEPHPLRVLRPERAPRLITPLPHKVRLLAAAGLDAIAVLPFTAALSQLSPRSFAQSILVQALGVAAVHEGANFQFGHRHAGTIDTLAELGKEFGFRVVVHPELRWRGEAVSSSRIRQLIAAGGISRAARLLGRWFSIRGSIAAGRGVGRQLTVPTLNLADYPELLPACGVYVSQTQIGARWYPSVTNCGVRPTFLRPEDAAPPVVVETHLLDFDPALAPEVPSEMEVCFLFRLREERPFPSPQALKAQILRDVAQAQRFLRRVPGRP